MNRFFLVIAAAFLLVGLVGAFGWLHWYMGRPAFIEDIRLALAETTGAEVELGEVKMHWPHGVELEEVTLRPGDSGESRLQAASIRIHLSPLLLLRGRMEISQIAVQGAELVLRPSANGVWPRFFAGIQPRVTLAGHVFPIGMRLTQVRLDQIRVEVRGPEGDPWLAAEGCQAEGGVNLLPGWADASGAVRIRELRLGSGLRLTNLTAPLLLANHTINLQAARAFFCGGTAEASASVSFARTVPSFAAQLALREVDVATTLEEAGARSRWAEGTLRLDAKVEGSLAQPQLARGVGQLAVEGAGMATLDVLGTIGQALGLSELRTPRFDRVNGEFKIADRRLTFYNLEGVSPLVELSGAGHVGFDGQLDLDMLLGLHPEIGDRIPANLLGRFNQRADQFRLITFKLSGPISNPTSNLPRKLLAESGGPSAELALAR